MPSIVSRIERYVRFACHPRHRFTLSELANPRGRCSRQGFLVVALGLIAMQLLIGAVCALTGMDLTGVPSLAINLAIFGLGLSACVQRLHDLGLRAWVILAAIACWLTVAFVAGLGLFLVTEDGFMDPGTVGYGIVLAMMMVPAFGGLLWLHTAPGQAEPNRFGPVPGRNGFAKAPKAACVAQTRDEAPDLADVALA
jgi:uncharacterized membrane protein YhaH (DUF805 family)